MITKLISPSILRSLVVFFTAASLSQAALVTEFQYEGNGDDAVGAFDGTLGTGMSFDSSPGSSQSPGGQSLNSTGSGAFDFDNGGTYNALNAVKGATLFTDFYLTANQTEDTRLIYVSTNLNPDGARAEIRLVSPSATTGSGGTYAFRPGGRAADANNFQSFTSAGQDLQLNTWYSVAAVFDYEGETLSLYLNGDAVFTGASAAAWTGGETGGSSSQVALVGGNNSGSFFTGNFDNTRIYNTALDQTAIQAISIPEPSSIFLVVLAFGTLCMVPKRKN